MSRHEPHPNAHSIQTPPGPIDDEAECGHGGSLFANDPPEWAVEPCRDPAVWRVELPNTIGTIAVCPFHLQRWTEAYPERADVYDQEFGAEYADAQPVRCWTTGRDLPRLTHGDDEVWKRIGLDQNGHARYYRRHSEGYRLLTFSPGWTVEDLEVIGASTILGRYELTRFPSEDVDDG